MCQKRAMILTKLECVDFCVVLLQAEPKINLTKHVT